ncbi:MAG: acyl-CoA thioesterase [Corynebacteriales bacterium]|nr:acyl-CoA thioesterase [Mycobacteriales bacterium]
MTEPTHPGHIESVPVHFEDLDAMGVVHNGRYVLLLERALSAYWAERGWPFDPSRSHFADIVFAVREFTITYHVPINTVGFVAVHFWVERLGTSSVVYGFRVISQDHTVVHAEGRRAQVKIDPTNLRPAPIGDTLRDAIAPLRTSAQ